jgi:hypothetical protein
VNRVAQGEILGVRDPNIAAKASKIVFKARRGR